MVDSAKARKMTYQAAMDYLDAFTDFAPSFDLIYIEPVDGAAMADGDTVFIFHFREDKTWQIAEALINGIPGRTKRRELKVLPLVLYNRSQAHVPQVIPPTKYNNSLAGWIAAHGFRQLRVAEEYKKEHMTMFFSGGIMQPVFPGEDRIVDFASVSEAVADHFP
jgi:2,3-bisphosphoglycerate-independent phosphoglycerate mutase